VGGVGIARRGWIIRGWFTKEGRVVALISYSLYGDWKVIEGYIALFRELMRG
jgi:hypothetical protein